VIVITLTQEEEAYATDIAQRKDHIQNAIGAKNKMTTSGHVSNCRAQLALAKLLGITWDTNIGNQDEKGGVVSGCRVRPVKKSDFDLLVRRDDEDEMNMVLCTTEKPQEYRFVGYIKASEAKKHPIGYFLPLPAHVVPQKNLTPIEKLLEIL